MPATAEKTRPSKKSKMSPAPATTEAAPLPESKPNTIVVFDARLADILRPKDNTRLGESDPDLAGLAANMAAVGLAEPVILAPSLEQPGKWDIAAGVRRITAALMLKWPTIPAHKCSPGELREIRAAENLQRRNLNPIEEAIAVADLMGEAEEKLTGTSGLASESAAGLDTIRRAATAAVANRLGKSEAWVRDRNFLGTLDKVTRELVVAGRLPMEHARELAKIADPDKRAELAERASLGGKLYKHGHRKNEAPMLMRELRSEVAKHIRSLAQVAWPLTLAFAGAPACTDCPANSANQTGLFEDGKVQWGTSAYDHSTSKEPEAGVCTNAACYGRKSGATNRAIGTGAKRVTVTVSALPKAERDKGVAAAIKQHQPEVVTAAAFAREVKAHRERYSAAAGKSKVAGEAKGEGGKAKRAETPETKAKRALEDAISVWERAVDDQIVAAAAKKPRVFHLLTALSVSELLDKAAIRTHRYDGKPKKPDPAAAKKVLQLLDELLGGHDAEGVLSLAIERHQSFIELGGLADAGLFEHTAAKLGLKIKPKPVLEKFLPKVKPEPKAKAAAAPAKKGAKKGKAAKLITLECGECGRGMNPGEGETVEGVLLCAKCIGGAD